MGYLSSTLILLFFLYSCNSNKQFDQANNTSSMVQSELVFNLPKIPTSMEFCGEKILLLDEDIRERLDREVIINTFFQSATVQYLKRANRFFPEIERILKEEGIPDDFKYLAVIESGLTQAVSPAGAQGIWQFMPKTAEQFNLEINNEIDERLHVEKSTRASCAYLRQAHDTLGDWILAAASYNRGIGGVRSDMRWQDSKHYFDTDMNGETGRYAFRILAMKLIFSNPEAYGYQRDKMELYKPFDTRKIQVRESIPNLALWANDRGINFKILTKLNPWLKTNKLTVSDNKVYELLLPTEKENLKPYNAYTK